MTTTSFNGTATPTQLKKTSLNKKEVLRDYEICCISRQMSLTARRDVLTGKAMFCTTDDGKEVLQVAMAKTFQKGDFRSGYYRGHTLMLALGLHKPEDFFAHLFADSNNDPSSGGRSTMNHHATPLIDKQGNWLRHTEHYNIASDTSSTAAQMARALGLSMASKKYRVLPNLDTQQQFSNNGNEVCFVNIGDASTSEGIFWEATNSATVNRLPMAISVWDDGYGISVSKKQQTTKASISKALEGFRLDESGEGMYIYAVKGWDYAALCEAYQEGVEKARTYHRPVLFHIEELTQPQGHSSSGSHERYKTRERLNWEKEHDCLVQFRAWILESELAEEAELKHIENEAKTYIKACHKRAWAAYTEPIKASWDELKAIYLNIAAKSPQTKAVGRLQKDLYQLVHPVMSHLIKNARQMLFVLRREQHQYKQDLTNWLNKHDADLKEKFNTKLYSPSDKAAIKVPVVAPVYSPDAPKINGSEILNHFFDKMLKKYPNTFAFGEDVGKIGDVNQGFAGLQDKYGKERVFDTGIREWSIMGKAVGMSMRGLRPIAEIQYLDYLIYGLSPLADDLATLRYRCNNQQMAPAIIRTRGHRLMGIWHSGSPMSMLIHSLRGMHVLVPRNMTQAAGFYNTLLQSDDPGLVIECLNGYRLKETLPNNLDSFTVPLGVPEVLQYGTDLTLVTYGSCVRIAQEAIKMLEEYYGISIELIDVQSLLPFDLEHRIVDSLKKTNRIIFLDEDVPGGATSYMMQEVLEKQNGYQYLDSKPMTITAKAHRPAYGWDGDYYGKPSAEDVVDGVLKLLREAEPQQY